MEQRVDLDPWAAELYSGNQLPRKHKWIAPTLTDHLFFAYPAPGTKEVTVKATDRFGNRYEEKIVLG
ncbi:calcineurin-like phosphoesterase C-terminal domain-containing protein [Flavihumibacter solisilvae]